VAGAGRAAAAQPFPGRGVYLIADTGALSGPALEAAVAAALEAGVGAVQYRHKGALTRAAVAQARALTALCARHGVPFLVNDRADLAALADADGVHVGQDDLSVADARAVLGPDAWVGVSCHSVAEARAAVRDGADYLGFGSVFPTRTKADAGAPRGVDALGEICLAVPLAVFAIGGVGAENIADVRVAGAAGAAVISAILGAQEPGRAAAELVGRWGRASQMQ